MQFLKTALRWCALPFVFMGAILVGCWMWWVFLQIPVAACPPPLASYAEDPASVTCGLLLGARLLLDIGGASMPGLMAVFLCALVAPAQRPLVASAAALAASALGLVYLLATLSLRSPMKLPLRADLLGIAAAPWLTVWLVVHLNRQTLRRRARPGGVGTA